MSRYEDDYEIDDRRGASSQGRRPQGDGRRPSGQRPAGQRPSGDRRPSGQRPAGQRPSGERRPVPRDDYDYDDYGYERRGSGSRPSGGGRSTPSGNRPSGSRGGSGSRPSDGRRPSSQGRGSGGGKPSSKGKGSSNRKQQEKKKRRRIILFIFEIVLLIVMVVILYGVTKVEKTGKVEIKEEDIVINETVKQAEETTMKGYRNIALFGVDSRDKELTKNTRTDTIMIASVNMDTGAVKLVSVYRDTYLNLGNDTYNKCNAAYAKGGPEQAINMLNMNMDMNVSDFVTIGFDGLIDVIDALGGVEIEVTDAEISHLNNYQISMVGTSSDGEHFTAKEGTDYIPVTSAGRQTLNGLQATAYCRIRYVGDDFQRTERQRTVLQAIADKARTASPTTLNEIANSVFPEVYTSLDLAEILEFLGEITKYSIVDTGGFPVVDLRATGNIGAKGSCVIPVNLRSNVVWLHQFLFEDDAYVPSATVEEISEHVYSDTNSYLR